VVRVNQISTKKGDRMAFVTLEDLQGQCDVVVFPRTWEETKDLWVQDRIVLVRGKAEKRGESVNVLCDAVQTYVTRALAAEEGDPYAALRAAPLFTDGNGHSRPAAQRPAPVVAPPRSTRLPVAEAAEDLSYGDDGGDTSEDGNSFALEEPEWLREAPPVYGDRVSVSGDRSAGNGEQLAVGSKQSILGGGEQVAPVEQSTTARTDPAADGEQPTAMGEYPLPPITDHRLPVTDHRPREIRVTVQRTPDAERDKRLLGWVVEVLKAKPGPDRFCIVVRKNGAAVQLDFPNDTTTFTPALEQQLVRRLGVGSVEVREGGEQ
jgi:hypothetical protein